MQSPLVSIIIPTYNRESLIHDTLASVINQSYQNWECLVVDDGSTDKTVSMIADYVGKDKRFRTFNRDRDPKGAPTCRNIGLSNAIGTYVIYLDSDDLLAPFCLEQRVRTFEGNSDKDFLVFLSVLFSDKPGDEELFWNIETEEDDILRFLRMDALWQTTGPIYKREYLLRMQGFREDLPFWQDFDLHLRCLLAGGTYLKCYDQPADVYIRHGRTDTISRRITFAGDKKVLQKRIDFYCDLVSYFRRSLFNHNKQYEYAILSMLYFLCAQYLIKHNNLRLWLHEWRRTQRLLLVNKKSVALGLGYVILLKISSRLKLLKPQVKWCASKFKDALPNYDIMKNNTLCKVKIHDRT